MVEMEKINMLIKSKRGWIRLVEVFIAILLLTGVLFVVTSGGNSSKKNTLYIEVSEKELAILRDIELNDTLRAEVLSVDSGNLPIEWEDFDLSGLQNVKERITYLTPSNLECVAKICLINTVCIMNGLSDGDVYAKSVIISANSTVYSPRELKLFCFGREI